jgi:hypothetical protein
MAKIPNRDARLHVEQRKPFEGSNIWGVWQKSTIVEDESEFYVVYSYGEHFPMYVWSEGVWFENEDKYSPTTSKHMGQCRPSRTTILLSTAWMRKLATLGYRGIAEHRILTGEPA